MNFRAGLGEMARIKERERCGSGSVLGRQRVGERCLDILTPGVDTCWSPNGQ